jgi:hypothetical protein
MSLDNDDELEDMKKIRKITDEFSFQYGEENLIRLLSVLIFEKKLNFKEYSIDLDRILYMSAEVARYNVQAEMTNE